LVALPAQDNVPAFDSKTAKEIVEYSLGRPIKEVFTSFEDKPIAAASLGQVWAVTCVCLVSKVAMHLVPRK